MVDRDPDLVEFMVDFVRRSNNAAAERISALIQENPMPTQITRNNAHLMSGRFVRVMFQTDPAAERIFGPSGTIVGLETGPDECKIRMRLENSSTIHVLDLLDDTNIVEISPRDIDEAQEGADLALVGPLEQIVNRIRNILQGVTLDPEHADEIHALVDARLVFARRGGRPREYGETHIHLPEQHVEAAVLEQAEFLSRDEQIRAEALNAAATACAALAGSVNILETAGRRHYEPSIRGIVQTAAMFEQYIRTGSEEGIR